MTLLKALGYAKRERLATVASLVADRATAIQHFGAASTFNLHDWLV